MDAVSAFQLAVHPLGSGSSAFAQANLAWKLALVTKGFAEPSLLDSVERERLPVVSQMLAATAQLYTHAVSRLKPKDFVDATDMDDDKKTGWLRWRNDALELYGVNYRYSDLVLDERAGPLLDTEDALAHAFAGYEGARTLRAGDRAPGASGLILEGKGVTLLELLNAHQHTVFIFAPGGQAEYAKEIVQAAQRYPLGILQTYVVTRESEASWGGTAVLADRDGTAHASYLVEGEKPVTVVVRPDLFVGAVVDNVQGLQEYFGKVLKV